MDIFKGNRGETNFPSEPDVPDTGSGSQPTTGKNEMWFPDAKIVSGMKVKGEYAGGHPMGLIVHATEGHQKQSITDGLNFGKSNGYAYMFIDQAGNIGQSIAFNKWGNHCGAGSWPGLKTNAISSQCVGVEIACAGPLKKSGGVWKSEFGTIIADTQVIEGPNKDNCKKGAYQRYTAKQVESLIELCIWLYRNNPKVFKLDFVLGHDEVAPNRKSDPGWSLGQTMPEFRKHLKSLV